jgi:Zn-dependent protease with chaperone function
MLDRLFRTEFPQFSPDKNQSPLSSFNNDFLYFYDTYPENMTARSVLIALILLLPIAGISQSKAVYSFPSEDSTLKNQLYTTALSKKMQLLTSLSGEHKDDYKVVYESRFELISSLMKSSRLVAEPDAHAYLQKILDRIVSVNEELKPLEVRLVFSRDNWVNAYSVGEGTLVINAGLLLRLKNEAELAFVLCHELAHYYLDHSGKSIQKMISTANSETVRAELKKLQRQEYGASAELDKLLKWVAFSSRRHSREHEAEADEMAMRFLAKTEFNGQGTITCLQMLDQSDDTTYYAPLDLPVIFNFPDFAFKRRWLQDETAIFSQMKGEATGLTAQEKDSLRTHPDCMLRIAAVGPAVRSMSGKKDFAVDAGMFRQLQERFSVEVIEELYLEKRYALHLYNALGLLQSGKQQSYAVYTIARVLNAMYEAQLQHQFGLYVEKENRVNLQNYNQLLRLLDRLRLNELAGLNYFFCRQYEAQMAGYTAFESEWIKAKEHYEMYTH